MIKLAASGRLIASQRLCGLIGSFFSEMRSWVGMESVERFFRFMVKREEIRLRKEAGDPWPWSDDPILNTYKFTNVRREDDRTTRWMRKNWTVPHADRPAGEIIFNCALFRYFGTVEFANAVGWQENWEPSQIIEIAQWRIRNRQRVFTGAYIIPTLGQRHPKSAVVCKQILSPLWHSREQIAEVALNSQSWRQTSIELRRLPGFGGTGFMAKEVLQDVMQTPVLLSAHDRNSWCPAGPGARRGLNRLNGRSVRQSMTEQHLLGEMLVLFDRAKTYLLPLIPDLELHDIQFQLCEFDKYERTRLGDGKPKSRYFHN